ncbi:unnamed protein product [Caenorhabditis sp. 36 PRJEB53466]|nr:unnamed protein product [Caenorhabditis sp. 36 PRJEB53466]
MPCEHCPHCKELEEVQRLLAEQDSQQFNVGFQEATVSVISRDSPSQKKYHKSDRGPTGHSGSPHESVGEAQPFGLKEIVLFADFDQCLPFVKDKKSGDGSIKPVLKKLRREPRVTIPKEIMVNNLDALIDNVFGDMFDEPVNPNAVILAPRKADVEMLNKEVFKRISGPERSFEAVFDGYVIRSDLNLHVLHLKEESILVLEEQFGGLPIGTRLQYNDNFKNHLVCRILDGPRAGESIDVGRVQRKLAAQSTDTQQWVMHFPVTLAFAMTIHGSQGRRFEKVGCWKLGEAFDHGMVYAAVSRHEGSEEPMEQQFGDELRKEFVSQITAEMAKHFKKRFGEFEEKMIADYLEEGLSADEANAKLKDVIGARLLEKGIDLEKLLQPCLKWCPQDFCASKAQEELYKTIMSDTKSSFLVKGQAGNGKTTLMILIAENMKAEETRVVCTAGTPQLAAQYHEGIPFKDLMDKRHPSSYDVIFIDHGNLIPKSTLGALDEMLRSVCGIPTPFGGKRIIIAADFEQLLPYTEGFVKREEESLREAEILSGFKKVTLGKQSENIPETKMNIVTSVDQLITNTFGEMTDPQEFERRVILSPMNHYVDTLNKAILKRYPGQELVLTGRSKAWKKDGKILNGTEYTEVVNRKLPDDKLALKPNAIVALMRAQEGFPKGTRLIFLEKNGDVLKCKVLTGLRRGTEVFVRPMELDSGPMYQGKVKFVVRRRQYPIQLEFAMTIDQSQGQFFDVVGLYEMQAALHYGQQYTAETRCRPGGRCQVYINLTGIIDITKEIEKRGAKLQKNEISVKEITELQASADYETKVPSGIRVRDQEKKTSLEKEIDNMTAAISQLKALD